MTWREMIITLAISLCAMIVLIFFVAQGDKATNEKASLEARVELLEKKMQQKVRPVIQINRASVYNTDGEVVIETVKELRLKDKGKRQKGKK